MNNEYSEMTVTIKLKSYELQSVCQIISKIKESNNQNKDNYELSLSEKMTVLSIFRRLENSGRRKAEKLESIGTEFRECMEFGRL
jgi:ribosomal protein S10